MNAVQIANDVITYATAIGIPTIIGGAFAIFRKVIGVQNLTKIQKELETKKTIVSDSVKFIEQVGKDIHGEDKFNSAADFVVRRFNQFGIPINDDEIKGLIEAAVKEIKTDGAALISSLTPTGTKAADINTQAATNSDNNIIRTDSPTSEGSSVQASATQAGSIPTTSFSNA